MIHSRLDYILDQGPYDVVYADPPWVYNDKLNCSKRGSVHKYAVLRIEDLCSVRVADLCAPDAVLFLWVTPPLKELGDLVVKKWGFKYVTIPFVWIKTTKDGKKFKKGMGHWTRGNAEIVYLAVKGKPHKDRVDAGIDSVIMTPLLKPHSAKPAGIRRRIEMLMRSGSKRLELFGRGSHSGWITTGYESDGLDFMEFNRKLKFPLSPNCKCMDRGSRLV